MEGLLIILIELIAAPLFCIFAGAVGLLVGSLGAILSAMMEMAMAMLGTSSNRPPPSGKPHPAPADSDTPRGAQIPPSTAPKFGTTRWPRRLLVASLSLLGLIIAAVLVINTWFIDDLLRWALARQEKRTGVHVEFEAVHASMLTGRYELRRVRVTRHNHPAGEIELSARSANVSLSLWSAWKPTVPIRSLAIDGLRGRYNFKQSMEKKELQSDATDQRALF